MLQHQHHPCHGWCGMWFFLKPGGYRVGDYFIPGDLTDVDDAAHRRQATVQSSARRKLIPGMSCTRTIESLTVLSHRFPEGFYRSVATASCQNAVISVQ
jgi:hypothetical protein